jgi:thiol-disulfide isomerase/thioredoxin
MKRATCWAVATLAASLAASAIAQDQVKSFDMGSLAQIVADAKGKPLVVMVWSLDCSYCEPSFKALADEQRRSGLKVATIATDSADDDEATRMIRKKLSDAHLQGEAWAFGPAPSERLRHAIDPNWRGEMPRSYWFNGRGGKKAYSGIITPEKISSLVSE